MKTVRPIPADFSIAIRYPSNAARVVHSRGIKLWCVDGDDNRTPIESCGALSVYADDIGIVWAEAELWCDEEGKPIFAGQPYIKGNVIQTKIFTCNVVEIQSAPSYSQGYRDAHEYITGKPPPLTALRMVGRRAVRT